MSATWDPASVIRFPDLRPEIERGLLLRQDVERNEYRTRLQQERIARLASQGLDTSEAQETLSVLEETHRLLVLSLDQVRHELARWGIELRRPPH